MNVIIVGCCKAGSLHRNAYYELKQNGIFDGKLFFVDKSEKPRWGVFDKDQLSGEYFEVKTYRDIHHLMMCERLDIDDVIVDICLPVGSMLTTIEQFKEYGFKNFICEKPFVFYREKNKCAEKILSGLNILKVENYLYSKPTIYAKSLIEKYDIKEKFVVSNFSKNRKMHSSMYRGFCTPDSTLTIWEIEIPHEIYLCNNLFGEIDKITYKCCSDMIVGDLSLKNHGKGTLVCVNKKGSIYMINSNLESTEMFRTIDAICENDYTLHIFYSPVCEDSIEFSSGVFLVRKGEIIENQKFREDNNMYEMLKDYYLTFKYKQTHRFRTVKSIIEYSDFMEKVLEENNLNYLFDIRHGIFSDDLVSNNLNINVIKELVKSSCGVKGG